MKNNIEPSHYDESELFICDCSDASHQMILQLYDFGKGGKELWRPANTNCELSMNVYLNSYLGFWKRLWLAIRYTFGYRSKYGEFDVVSLRYEDIPRMKAILDKFISRVDEYKKKLEDDAELVLKKLEEKLDKEEVYNNLEVLDANSNTNVM